LSATPQPAKTASKYFDAVDVDAYSRSAAEDADAYARSALLRRRPDLVTAKREPARIPEEERAQYELDRLSFVHAVVDRLKTDIIGLVFAARQQRASWARIGLAIDESGQTAFNRYHRLDRPPAGPAQRSAKTKPRTAR
jgi:hypothetical protein